MNLKKYNTQITEHKLYIEGDTDYPKKTITSSHLHNLNLISISYIDSGDELKLMHYLNESIRNKLDKLLLSHTDKKEWEDCLLTLHPKNTINSTLYPNISFLSQKNRYQENFLAYWSDTLKIGNIIHPHNHDDNYNEFMTILISQEKLDNTIHHITNNKQNNYKI